jgi:hypothetical protein
MSLLASTLQGDDDDATLNTGFAPERSVEADTGAGYALRSPRKQPSSLTSYQPFRALSTSAAAGGKSESEVFLLLLRGCVSLLKKHKQVGFSAAGVAKHVLDRDSHQTSVGSVAAATAL